MPMELLIHLVQAQTPGDALKQILMHWGDVFLWGEELIPVSLDNAGNLWAGVQVGS